MSEITAKNWNYCQYKNNITKAFIGTSAEPGPYNTIIELFSVTVTDEDNKELFQKDFEKLDNAIDFINDRYSHWEFRDPTQKSDAGGCGSCAAH